MRLFFIGSLSLVAACVSPASTGPEASPATQHFQRLASLCDGNAYAGRLVSTDAADADFSDAKLIMGPAQCEEQVIRVPFAVNEDRSRTWVITRTAAGLRLKHDHRHKDGSEDVLTQYGGDSAPGGDAMRQDYPADEETKALFIREEIEVSTQNTWSVDIAPGDLFAYQMSRPERLFRVEFDLSMPVEAPPPPWGAAPVE